MMMSSLVWFALVSTASAFHVYEQDEFHFKSWMAQHNKVYSMQEYYERLEIFTENKRRIDKHNEGNQTFTMGLNQFSDMTFGEFQKSFLWSEPQNCSATKGSYFSSKGALPDFIDWRKKGNYVTDVKNQGPCGSCWTFSTTGCLESVTAIHTGKLVPLSEQQLVDCAQDFNNHGCNGGLPSQAFEYIMYNKGLMTEEDYPYKAIEHTCVYKPGLAAAFVKDVVNITEYDEMGMVDAVATLNPVSFAFEVTSDFMHYSTGVYTRDNAQVMKIFHYVVDNALLLTLLGPNILQCHQPNYECTECHQTPDKVNHAVLAVGYGQQDGTPYWIVKNSWGSLWGIDGYFLIERGKNMCGLAACSSFPVV